MSRSQRLLDLLQLLRRHRRPVSGERLASLLGISIRTLYRDIAALRAQGADVQGEPGLGYVLRPGFVLPPLMFSHDEIEALVLGSRWVSDRADQRLGEAADDALAKISAVLPTDLRELIETSSLLVGPGTSPAQCAVDVASIRQAIRLEKKLAVSYRDGSGMKTERTIWPIALGFFDQVQVLVGWCELRQGFRHFRLDRLGSAVPSAVRYPRRRQALLKEWREIEGIPPPD